MQAAGWCLKTCSRPLSQPRLVAVRAEGLFVCNAKEMNLSHRIILLGVGGCILAACSGPSADTKSSVRSSTTAPSAKSTATSTSSRSVTTTLPQTSETTTSSTSAPAVQNLVVTNTIRAALVAAFVSFKDVPAQQIAGTQPGTTYYAYVPSTGTYWALASFLPTSSASLQTDVSLQDGGSMGIFDEQSGKGWKMLAQGVEPFCPSRTAIPSSVLTVWGLSDVPACSQD